MALKIRRNKAGSAERPYMAHSMTIPVRLVRMISRWEEREFEPRLIDAGDSDHRGGILMELVEPHTQTEEAPSWAR